MAQIRGMMITQVCLLMTLYEEGQKKAADYVLQKTGKHYEDLDPNEFYDVEILNEALKIYSEYSPTRDRVYITHGTKVYPLLKQHVGFPPHLKTPLDFILFEAESFIQNHRGSDVIPRNFLKTDDRHIIVDAPSPGYNCKIIEGVFLGILKMLGEENGKVIQTKCIQRGDSTCIYDITW
jgi:hypothetical protein